MDGTRGKRGIIREEDLVHENRGRRAQGHKMAVLKENLAEAAPMLPLQNWSEESVTSVKIVHALGRIRVGVARGTALDRSVDLLSARPYMREAVSRTAWLMGVANTPCLTSEAVPGYGEEPSRGD